MTDFLVKRDDLRETRISDSAPPDLGPGLALLRVESFGPTANNITYAVFGEAMSYARGLRRAVSLACTAHGGQRYPSPQGEPYVLHLLRVMLAVEGESARMAAVLHDILEDTSVTVADLREHGIPERVVDAVGVLTHLDSLTYEEYIEEVDGDNLAREVKLADLADNLANNRRLPEEDHVVERIGRYERAIARLTREAVPDPGPRH